MFFKVVFFCFLLPFCLTGPSLEPRPTSESACGCRSFFFLLPDWLLPSFFFPLLPSYRSTFFFCWQSPTKELDCFLLTVQPLLKIGHGDGFRWKPYSHLFQMSFFLCYRVLLDLFNDSVMFQNWVYRVFFSLSNHIRSQKIISLSHLAEEAQVKKKRRTKKKNFEIWRERQSKKERKKERKKEESKQTEFACVSLVGAAAFDEIIKQKIKQNKRKLTHTPTHNQKKRERRKERTKKNKEEKENTPKKMAVFVPNEPSSRWRLRSVLRRLPSFFFFTEFYGRRSRVGRFFSFSGFILFFFGSTRSVNRTLAYLARSLPSFT